MPSRAHRFAPWLLAGAAVLALPACKDKDRDRAARARDRAAAQPSTEPQASASARPLAPYLGAPGLFTLQAGAPILGANLDQLRAAFGAHALEPHGDAKYILRLAAAQARDAGPAATGPLLELAVRDRVVARYLFRIEYRDQAERQALEQALSVALGGKPRPVHRGAHECAAYPVPGAQGEPSSQTCAPDQFACEQPEVAVCDSEALRALAVFVQPASPPIPYTMAPASALAERAWRPVEPAIELSEEPREPSLTLLADGRVLLVGGIHWSRRTNDATLYDPATGVIDLIPSTQPRTRQHSATLLADGTVLVAGGSPADVTQFHASLAQAQRLDPKRKRWLPVPAMRTPRYGHSAFRLADGRVLVLGGTQTSGEFLRSTEIYDPKTNRWTPGPALNQGRWQHAAVALRDGRILVAGSGEPGAEMTSEIYDPAARVWSMTGALNRPWFNHQMALLPDGRAWLVGESFAQDPSQPYVESELYDPDLGQWTLSAADSRAWMSFAVVPVAGGVLLAGGHQPASEGAAGEPLIERLETLFFEPKTETLHIGPSLPASHVGDWPGLLVREDAVFLFARNAKTPIVLGVANPSRPGAPPE